VLRGELGGIEGARTLAAAVRMMMAAALLGAAALATWQGLDALLGRSLVAQALAVLASIAAGLAVYVIAVWVLRVPEARQIRALLPARPGAS
jgi:putative peptidoglycan lipid II flippase